MCFACWIRIEMEAAVRYGHNELVAAEAAQQEIDTFFRKVGKLHAQSSSDGAST